MSTVHSGLLACYSNPAHLLRPDLRAASPQLQRPLQRQGPLLEQRSCSRPELGGGMRGRALVWMDLAGPLHTAAGAATAAGPAPPLPALVGAPSSALPSGADPGPAACSEVAGALISCCAYAGWSCMRPVYTNCQQQTRAAGLHGAPWGGESWLQLAQAEYMQPFIRL